MFTSSDIFELSRFLWTHVFRKLKAVVCCSSRRSSGQCHLICWGNPRYPSCLAHRQTTASTSAPRPLRSIQTFPPSPRQCRRCVYIWVNCLQQDSSISTFKTREQSLMKRKDSRGAYFNEWLCDVNLCNSLQFTRILVCTIMRPAFTVPHVDWH